MKHQFEALLHEHRKIIWKLAAAFTRQPQDRQDLAQEITIQLWRAFPRFQPEQARFSTWMYRIALNVAISQFRRDTSSLAARTEPLEDHHLNRIANPQPDSEDNERLDALWALIDQFEPLNRALIVLYLEDRSHAEIAEIIGISPTNVATKISRIKQTLRQQMKVKEPENGIR
jgi:RNA polymerase sigma-70 factor (ECF subfamily)